MTADYCGYPLEVVDDDTKAKASYPCIVAADGTIISESNAIAAYIARIAGHSEFLGKTAFEEALVEEWLSFSKSTLEQHMKRHAMHVCGIKKDPSGATESVSALKEAAKVINAHLEGKYWLVGERMTLADIVVFNSLIFPFKLAFDA